MKIRKLTALMLTAIICLNSCKPINQTIADMTNSTNTDSNSNPSGALSISTGIGTPEKDVTSNYSLETPQIEPKTFIKRIEAETGNIAGDLTVKKDRMGYSQDGYVTNFNKSYADKAILKLDIPTSQHYDISVCAAADETVKNALAVNGESEGQFEISGDGKFIKATFYGIFIEKGTAEISIDEIDGAIDFDYIEISNNQNVKNINYDIAPTLTNPNASQSTQKLMQYLTDNYGKKLITGQYSSDEKNIEMELIYKITGQYPAIRFGDMKGYSLNGRSTTREIEASIEWAERGGIVGLMWYWNAPMDNATVYAQNTNFDLSKAVNTKNISLLSMDELESLNETGGISAECLAIIKDIDNISEQLKRLRDADIPVLWRPLHEAGGQWFWWGSSGPEAYKWLWDLMYTRMTQYHKLDNLIWIWNGQDDKYLISDKLYDIASVDIYLSGKNNFGSRLEQYQWLYKVTNAKKLMAVSECGNLPDVNDIFRDNSIWSFFGLWYGSYLMTSDGSLSETYNTREQIEKMYNCDVTINLYKYVKRNIK